VSEPPPPPPPPPYYGYGYGYGGYPPQPYWQPPPQIDSSRLRPSRLWYWLSPIPFVIGAIVAIVSVVAFIDNLDPDIENFSSNRTAVVDVHEGHRAIYVQTTLDSSPRQLPPGDLRCRVSSLGDNAAPVAVERSGGSTLDVNDDSYKSEYKFNAPHDGRYRVVCEGPEGVPLAVGPYIDFHLFVPLVVAIAALILGAIASAVIAIVTAVRRSNHKMRLQREAREAQAGGSAP
jgi:hypothetical protein